MEQPRSLMRDQFKKKDLLGNISFKQSHLYATFFGVRQAFKKFLKIDELPFVHNNDVKMMQRQKFEPSYPYAYVSVNGIGYAQDHMSASTIRRHGLGHAVNMANATLTKHYFFPISLTVELHYITNDTLDAMRYISEAIILISSKALSFRLTQSGISGVVGIKADTQEIPLPRADKENEADPETHDIVLSFTVSSWTGVSKEVAKINNDGRIIFDAIVVNHNGVTVDEETSVIEPSPTGATK